ncbi:uncharacterized protein LOC144360963, partial [Saccoglossus kowalevskii]
MAVGDFTCRSVVDYVIVSLDLFEMVNNLEIPVRVESDHFPLCYTVEVNAIPLKSKEAFNNKKIIINKYIWSDDRFQTFHAKIWGRADDIRNLTNQEIGIDNMNIIVQSFTEILNSAGEDMLHSTTINQIHNQKRSNKPWFNQECRNAKTCKLISLQRFRESGTNHDLALYKDTKRDYENLIKLKKNNYDIYIQDELRTISDEKCLWSVMKKQKRHAFTPNQLEIGEWANYFKNLCKTKCSDTNDDLQPHDNDNPNLLLNAPISQSEILNAVYNLKKNKSAGPDMIIPEFLKYSCDLTVPLIHTLFNSIFNTGHFPQGWSRGVIVPVYKKNNTRDPNNYRAISLLSVFSKIFTGILNQRLKAWANEYNKIPEVQAGFREGYSTIDHVFTLSAIIQRYLSRR